MTFTRGKRVWTCDQCGKRETWRKGWRYYPGVESNANKVDDGRLFPMSVCSQACEEKAFDGGCMDPRLG